MRNASAPVFLIGAGIKSAGCEDRMKEVISRLNIPVVSSMIAFDVMKDEPQYFGFIGAYGARTANFVLAKADLIISIGTRMDIRQVGAHRDQFAPNAKIIRFDVDRGELEYKVHDDEHQIVADINSVVSAIKKINSPDCSGWLNVCNEIKKLLLEVDDNKISKLIFKLSEGVPNNAIITTDVGQNQVWVAQSFRVKSNQKVLFSGGHGAMGYSLPAAIGAYYGS